jgi:GT2 family glycosyltransferase
MSQQTRGSVTGDVAIIVVSYNTRQLLHDCLASVYMQTSGISFETYVVDNDSNDGSQDMIRTEFPRVRLIANNENKGFAAANNQAIRVADARYVLLLNPDTIVLERVIQKSVAYMDANLDVGALGCKVRWPDMTVQGTIFRFPGLLDLALDVLRLPYLFESHPFFDRARYGAHDTDKARDVDCVAGCYMLVRMGTITKAGVLDEDFFMYGEEMEWCWRIWKSGVRIVYYPGASIIHLKGQSTAQFSGGLKAAVRRAAILFLDKTRGSLTAWVSNFIMFLGVLIRVPVWFPMDFLNKLLGKPDLMRAHWRIVHFHAVGLLSPIWRKDIRY